MESHEDAEGKSVCRLLIFDLDNTLYDWVDYFAPAFRAMVHFLAHRLGEDEAQLTTQFSALYEYFGTTEYPFTVQLLPALSAMPSDERLMLARHAHTVFSRSRIKRMIPYPCTIHTLRWARNASLNTAILTSAPQHNVMGKLHRLGMLPYIDVVVAWRGYNPEEDEVAKSIRGSSGRHRQYRQELIPLEREELKSIGMTKLLKRFGVRADETAMVGDSLQSDIRPAVTLGIRAFWARYGLNFDVSNRHTIEAITPGGADAVAHAYSLSPVPADVSVLNSLCDLTKYLRVGQESLF